VLVREAQRVIDAKIILVIGGGPTGVELAAEIIDKYPKKEVYLVHSQSALLQRLPPKAQNYALYFLQIRGVKVLLEHRVLPLESKDKAYHTDKGAVIPADLAFLCTGLKPNSEPLREAFPRKISPLIDTRSLRNLNHTSSDTSSTNSPSTTSTSPFEKGDAKKPELQRFASSPPMLERRTSGSDISRTPGLRRFRKLPTSSSIALEEDGTTPMGISTGRHDGGGFLKVNKYLQLQGEKNIFVAGDVTASTEEKLAQTAESRAVVVVKNVTRLAEGKPLTRIYKETPKPVVISLGYYDGVFVYKNFALCGFIPAILKEIVEWKTMARYIYRISLPF